MNTEFNGQELYTYDGGLVFIVTHTGDKCKLVDYHSGQVIDKWVDENELKSASPEELEDMGI